MKKARVLAGSRSSSRHGSRGALVALGLVTVLTLAACGSGARGSGNVAARSGGGQGSTSSSTTPSPAGLVIPPTPLPFASPPHLRMVNGTLLAATVTDGTGRPVGGSVDAGGAGWTSARTVAPGTPLTVTATLRDRDGTTHQQTITTSVAEVPDSQRLTLTMTPGAGDVVGIGAPVVVRFDQSVTDRAGVERAATVASSIPVEGSWHWVNNRELHFRPRDPWPTGTRVRVDLGLAGVRVGPELWGGRDYQLAFSVGDARTATVDATAHTMTVKVNGRTTATWPTSLGQPAFATRNGTYIVLSKTPSLRMTSCSARIQCTPGAPNWYDLTVLWDVRLSWSGTFVHAAPWSANSQGVANVSHGCINLGTAPAREYFNQARYGDLVTVVHSTRGPRDLVDHGDPGMTDWNSTWTSYVAGSALGAAVTTQPLAG